VLLALTPAKYLLATVLLTLTPAKYLLATVLLALTPAKYWCVASYSAAGIDSRATLLAPASITDEHMTMCMQSVQRLAGSE
jgi:hypothetical protein